jgi:putative ABC transport system permease protein
MNTISLIVRELRYRRMNAGLAILSAAVAVSSLLSTLVLLSAHDMRTTDILELKETALAGRMDALNRGIGKTMLKLGFNLVILPEGQDMGDWYANDYASEYMPESYVTRLADSGIVTVRHFLPSLQQKIKWPEKKRTIILVGTRGEVPNLHMNQKKPLVQPVPPGTIVLGYELHNSMSIKVGDIITLMGKTFVVHRCHTERGNKDDITAWISLDEAQVLLEKPDKINAILALQCNCPDSELHKIRAEVAGILPGTRVIERTSRAVARAESREKVRLEGQASIDNERTTRAELRKERQTLASLLIPVAMLACAVWIGLLTAGNVRERESEIAILRALGVGSAKIFALFLSRAALLGIIGGVIGLLIGQIAARQFNVGLPRTAVVGALAIAPALSILASWLPSLIAARKDPADILRKE